MVRKCTKKQQTAIDVVHLYLLLQIENHSIDLSTFSLFISTSRLFSCWLSLNLTVIFVMVLSPSAVSSFSEHDIFEIALVSRKCVGVISLLEPDTGVDVDAIR